MFLIVLLALAAGCSSVRFSYNQGDTLSYWWINSYVDLEGEQSDMAKREIRDFFQWHRQTQLRDYGTVLAKMQRQLAGNPTQADLMANYREVKARAETAAFHAAPKLAELALSMTPQQIANMEEKFKSKNADYRKKFLSGNLEKRQKERFKKSMSQFELWFGNFNNEQEAALRKASDARPADGETLFEERLVRQRKILTLLRKVQQERPSKEATTAMVNNLLREMLGRMESPERKQFFDAYADSTAKYVLTAIRIATPAQKAHAQQRMQSWIDDFTSLAASR